MTSDGFDRRAIIVGSGVAGLTTALALGDCMVITKTTLGEGSSTWAQGGIAAAVGPDDDPADHADDTVAVGGGLTDPIVARLVTAAGPERIAWLRSLGAEFDTDATGELTLGREAGHGAFRIVDANGDATGAELMRTLRDAVRRRADIEVREHTTVVDLVRSGDHVAGVFALDAGGEREVITAPAVVLATGGIGRVYAATTNPVEVTGDGMAMAQRAGARIADPEFMQFHPTALRSTLDPMPLLTEALRGAGAKLVLGDGTRFMSDVHPDAELAPRDVVARANWRQLHAGNEVLLDATHLGASFPDRFPTVFASAMRAGIDPRVAGMPVSPAAHYHMGGVAVDEHGRSSVPGLYVCGEASVTGLHGANRLASNSLLEGLVFGGRVAAAIDGQRASGPPRDLVVPAAAFDVTLHDDRDAIARLRSIMWDSVGVMRDDAGLRSAVAELETLLPRLASGATGRNLGLVALTVAKAALARTESRGVHHRTDHPATDPMMASHTIVESDPVAVTPLGVHCRVA